MTTATRRLVHTTFLPPIGGALSFLLFVLANVVARGSLDVGSTLISLPIILPILYLTGLVLWIVPGLLLWIVFQHTPLRSRRWAGRPWAFLTVGAFYGFALSFPLLITILFVHDPSGGRYDLAQLFPWVGFFIGLTAGWCNLRVTRRHIDAGGEEYDTPYLRAASTDRTPPA